MWPGPAGFNHKRAKMSTTSSMIYCPRQPMIKSWRSRDATPDGCANAQASIALPSLWSQQRERQQDRRRDGDCASVRAQMQERQRTGRQRPTLKFQRRRNAQGFAWAPSKCPTPTAAILLRQIRRNYELSWSPSALRRPSSPGGQMDQRREHGLTPCGRLTGLVISNWR
jgi:hypothetical protein